MLNCRVLVNGTAITNMLEGHVSVSEALNQHSYCSVEFARTEDDKFAVEDTLGQPIAVFSLTPEGDEILGFEGFVLECEAQNELNNLHSYRIVGVSRSYKLDVALAEKYFRQKTLSDVAKQLCGDYQLNADVQAAGNAKRNFVQWGETAFGFLKRIADFNQAWVLPTAQGLRIADKFSPEHKVAWTGEGGLQQFRMSARLGAPSVSGVHYDPKKMKSTLYEKVSGNLSTSSDMAGMVRKQKSASASALPSAYESYDGRCPTPSDYEEMLKREAMRSLGGQLSASGTSRTEGIRAGQKLTIEGSVMGAGTYGVVHVSHHWNLQDYTNEFICTPWAQWVEAVAPVPHRIFGVVSARVKSNNDEKKMGRLKIQYDWQEEGETSWARMASPHAGADRGMLFLPEVGDEVLVAFEQGDPERPYVIGSLWNGVDLAPRDEFWGGDVEPNDIKRIVTKSGHRIQIIDKPGKESIVIATPSKLKIGLYENASETNRPMLAIHSEGDLMLSAPNGRIHFHSKYFSREIGGGGGASSPVPAAPKPAVSPPPKAPAGPPATATRTTPAGTTPVSPARAAIPGSARSAAFQRSERAGNTLSNPGAGIPRAGIFSSLMRSTSGRGVTGTNPLKDKQLAEAISKSPTLTSQLDHLKSQNWTVEYGPAGKGSFTSRAEKKIVLDSDEHGNTAQLLETLSHEVGHASRPDPLSIDPGELSKAEYVKASTRQDLLDEADATINNIRVKQELARAHGVSIGVAGAYAKEYEKIYSDSKGDASKAREKIADLFGTECPSTAPSETYKTYYGGYHARYYDEVHSADKKVLP